MKQEHQALEEQTQKLAQELRLQQQVEMKRQEQEKAKLQTQCQALILQIAQLHCNTNISIVVCFSRID